ncbi:hypothetical protein QBC38DRAFT_494592 [Podospora fimiseda]|uniref:RBR-type E3 ubiquitin transferase n=1 Tax=Podospora fimiseda TaxID=252190 RepID=A0AAN7BZP0_9PEZI|nr:hypothetical protein QBC38DRAFT_494592 [Podospora fimiseda]
MSRLNRRSLLTQSDADVETPAKSSDTTLGKGVAEVGEEWRERTKTQDELKSRIQSLEQEVKKLQQYKDLFQSFNTPLTARTLLSIQTPLEISATQKSDTTPNPSGLDISLSLNEAIGFSKWLVSVQDDLGLDSCSTKVCCLCERALFFRIPSIPPSSNSLTHALPPSEFNCSTTGTFSCSPSEPICDDCFLPAMISSITKDFWHNLDSELWIKCPHPECENILLPPEYHTDLARILSNCRDPYLSRHMRLYTLAKGLRSRLKSLSPLPTPEAITHSIKFYKHLEKQNLITLLDHRLIAPHQPPEVKLLPMDISPQKTLQVPIFTGLLLTSKSPLRECIICAELHPDITDGTPTSEETWSKITSKFPGSYSHLLRPFPPPSSLPTCASSHPLNTCRPCLSLTIQSQLSTLGPKASSSLKCPLPSCPHIYTHSELSQILDSSTFTLYDRHRLTLHLSTEPNFRWCLNEHCKSGQIYSVYGPSWNLIRSPSFLIYSGLSNPQRNKITCQECNYQMCFEHQVPWHNGLSCLEYDQTQTQNPNERETNEWIRNNTKECSCGARVEKKGGCWHMTCFCCGREFCWECLEDWEGNIVVRNTETGEREYRREGHKEGCYFRGEGALMPTVVLGDVLEEGVRDVEGIGEEEWEF